jgi:hypothetical protein
MMCVSSDVDYISDSDSDSDSGDDLQLQKTSLYCEDWSAIMEQMIPINYVGHGGTYDQQRRNRWRKDYRI